MDSCLGRQHEPKKQVTETGMCWNNMGNKNLIYKGAGGSIKFMAAVDRS